MSYIQEIDPSGVMRIHNLDRIQDGSTITIGSGDDFIRLEAWHGVEQNHLQLRYYPQLEVYQVILLSRLSNTFINGRPMPFYTLMQWQDGDAIRIGNYELILFTSPVPYVEDTPAPSDALVPTTIATGGFLPVGSQNQNFEIELRGFPMDEPDTVRADFYNPIRFFVVVHNLGNLVANFKVSLDHPAAADWGGWYRVNYPNNRLAVKVFEGQASQPIEIIIRIERQPKYQAGSYPLELMVSSSEYGAIKRELTLIVPEFHGYTVRDNTLRPRVLMGRSLRRPQRTAMEMTYLGNGEASYRLEGDEERRACDFEFEVDGGRFRAPSLRLNVADNVKQIDIFVAPHTRPTWFGTTYRFGIKVMPQQTEGQEQQSFPGELRQTPWPGVLPVVLSILAAIFLCLALSFWVLYPRVQNFTLDGDVTQKQIVVGEQVEVAWEARFPFSDVRIEPEPGLVDGTGSRFVGPTEDTIYVITADNFLSQLLPSLQARQERRVIVSPLRPDILTFNANPVTIISGAADEAARTVALTWEVENVNTLTLSENGNLLDTFDNPTDFESEQRYTPDENTTYTLLAENEFGFQDQDTVQVIVQTATPIPPAMINFFTVSPSEIVAGQTVNLNWSVTGADNVIIEQLGPEPLPPQGSITQAPLESLTYILQASRDGEDPVSLVQEVIVSQPTGTPTPTSTPEPEAPIIEQFIASQNRVIVGDGDTDDDNVTFSWVVVPAPNGGQITDVRLESPPDFGPIVRLTPNAELEIPINEDRTIFVLTAYNGDKSNSLTVPIEVETATPTPTTTPTPEPPPTNTPAPSDPIVFFMRVQPVDSDDRDKITQSGSRYTVEAGTDIKLVWETSSDATGVNLSPLDESFGPGDSEFELLEFSLTTSPSSNNPKEYTVIATKDGASGSGEESVIIEVVPPRVPPSPGNVSGTPEGDNNTITWSFPGDDEDILGFRVYRADMPPGNNFAVLDDVGPDVSEYVDEGGGCGKLYYVTTLYPDISLNEIETNPSSTSWASDACN